MTPNQKKQVDFVLLLCPGVTMKSGNKYFTADWEVTDPKELLGHSIVVTREDSRPIMTIKLLRMSEDGSVELVTTKQLEPARTGEFYLNSRLISIKSLSQNNNEILMTGFHNSPLRLIKRKLFGEV